MTIGKRRRRDRLTESTCYDNQCLHSSSVGERHWPQQIPGLDGLGVDLLWLVPATAATSTGEGSGLTERHVFVIFIGPLEIAIGDWRLAVIDPSTRIQLISNICLDHVS